MKKLKRSRKKKLIAGVCGGFSNYFNIDVNLIRLIWLALFLAYFTGPILYVAAIFLLPEEAPSEGDKFTFFDEWVGRSQEKPERKDVTPPDKK